MMVIYAYDPKSIFVDPLQDRTKESILQAYQNIIDRLTKIVSKPIRKQLNNESPQLFQNEMDSDNINW